MARRFNITGSCNPGNHYMVNIEERLAAIKTLVDSGAYFTINRARQYGKTTTLDALAKYLKDEYIVFLLDFQRIGNEEFESAGIFSTAFAEYILEEIGENPEAQKFLDGSVTEGIRSAISSPLSLRRLFVLLSKLCKTASRPIVLMIDEVDSASNNQVFLDFLAQLRAYYLERTSRNVPTFHSVILAGVYDVKNIKRKLRADDAHKVNSPWNIAADFNMDMSFSKDGIEGMLKEYESDHDTGMDTERMAGLIYEYTFGYPFLVSWYCQLIDERVAGTDEYPTKTAAWTREGFLAADRIVLSERNTLFESMIAKLTDYPELNDMLYRILFTGQKVAYNPDNAACELGTIFGIIRNCNGSVSVANRTFETRLYNYFISQVQLGDASYLAASRDKNQFVENGILDMDLVLNKFVIHFHDVYGEKDERFIEEYGRKFFLLYLKPIINGVGHYYIEAETRDEKRTDVIVDYLGRQFVIELKIWGGQKYHREGEEQLIGYLERYHLDKGYLLTFSFNQNKEIGVKEMSFGDKTLLEATV